MRSHINYFLAVVITLFVVVSVSNAKDPLLFTLNGTEHMQNLGFSLSGNGDVNNDGFDDLVVGAPYNGVAYESGKAFVFSGLTQQVLYSYEGEAPGDGFGRSVSIAGDVNNDGYDDFIIGASMNDYAGVNAGRAYVYSGIDGELLYMFDGESAGDGCGMAVSTAGDVDGDGYDDLLIGAPGNDESFENAGKCYIYSGQTGNLLYSMVGEGQDDSFGRYLSGGGDVDGDGFGDVIIGAWNNSSAGDETGRVYVFSGNTGNSIHVWDGEAPGDHLGRAVASAGDVNGDSYDDVVVGTPFNDAGGLYAGRVYVFSGQDGGVLYTFTGTGEYEQLGLAVSGAGDINGDGYDDIVAGTNGDGTGNEGNGKALLYSGSDGQPIYMFANEVMYDAFGQAVARAGDVDGDGKADLMVSAFNLSVDNAGRGGRLYVYTYCCDGSRGDVNNDGNDANVLDLNFLVNKIFRNGELALCSVEADVNGDGMSANILDLNFLVNRVFRSGPAPGPCN